MTVPLFSVRYNVIESYDFGEIKICGKTYRADIIIYPNRVNAHWWRKQGHHLDMDDIKEVLDAKPEVIIIGTGKPGLMQVDDRTRKEISERGIEAIIVPTDEACREYNRIVKNKKVIACLHLTC